MNAYISTRDVTAVGGYDFVSLSNSHLFWGNGDGLPKGLSIEIIDDDVAEYLEKFQVYFSSVNGTDGDPIVGLKSELVVFIAENDQDIDDQGMVGVRFHVFLSIITDIPPGSVHRRDFADKLLQHVAESIGTTIERLRLYDVSSGPTIDGQDSAFVLLDILKGQNKHDKTPSTLAHEFYRQFADPNSTLYDFEYGVYFDSLEMPLIIGEEQRPTRSPSSSGGDSTGLVVGLVVFFVVLVALVGVVYWKRVPVSEWIMWKLGNFRFTTLREERSAAAASSYEEEEMEETRMYEGGDSADGIGHEAFDSMPVTE